MKINVNINFTVKETGQLKELPMAKARTIEATKLIR